MAKLGITQRPASFGSFCCQRMARIKLHFCMLRGVHNILCARRENFTHRDQETLANSSA